MKALRHTPAAPSRCACAAARLRRAAMIRAAFARARHPGFDVVVGRLERQHHDGDRTVSRAGVIGLRRIEDAAVRRIKSRLRDRAHGARGGEKVLEMHRAAGPLGRAILQPHPGLRDDAENALRADHHAIRARPGAGAGQAAALDHALRRNSAQRFHEIVDMGVERREVPAAARRDPAAERGIFKALREVAEGESHAGAIALRARARRCRLRSARRARSCRSP